MPQADEKILDEFLVAAARAGDRRAFGLLARRWAPKLLAHARRLSGEAELARDATQDGWTEIVRSIGRLEDARAFPAFAYRIVTRTVARAIRNKTRARTLAAAVAAEPAPPDPAPPEAADLDRLRVAIRDLPADQRAAIALYYFEEMAVAEVAVALDVPAGTVKTRLLHARRRLRSALEGETP